MLLEKPWPLPDSMKTWLDIFRELKFGLPCLPFIIFRHRFFVSSCQNDSILEFPLHLWLAEGMEIWKFFTQILREINFWDSRSAESAIFRIWLLIFTNFCTFWWLKLTNCQSFLIFRALNFVNLANFRFWDSEIAQLWFHVKFEWQKNSVISTLCVECA